MAHNPVENQSELSDNATLHYYVGPAPHTKQGILLYNPKTKLFIIIIIRRSFQPLGCSYHGYLTIPQLPLSVHNNTTPDLSLVTDSLVPSSSPLPTSFIQHPSSTPSVPAPTEEIQVQLSSCRRRGYLIISAFRNSVCFFFQNRCCRRLSFFS